MNLKNISFFISLFSLPFLIADVHRFIIFLCLFTIPFIWFAKSTLFKNVFKIFILLVTTAFLIKIYHGVMKTEFGVSLILVLSFLKLFELESFDDFFNMFLILILLESSIFIVNPSVLVFSLGLIKIIFFFYFLLKLSGARFSNLNWKRLLVLLVPAIVFSSLLYLTFPRFTQGFASFNTGLVFNESSTNNIDVSQLGTITLSDKKIFRAYNLPTNYLRNSELYWKTNVLWDFRKLRWRSGNLSLKENVNLVVNSPTYTIKTENIYFDFIPLLDVASSVSVKGKIIAKYIDGGQKIIPPSKGQFEVHVSTKFEALRAKDDFEIQKASDLISKLDTDYRSKVFDPRFDMKRLSNLEKLENVKRFFVKKNFEYSLSPPNYKNLDDFLTNGKLGYCTHFAASFAYLLRTVGVPSRVVLGYQGGEISPFDNSVLVRERDSHAWVEYLNNDNVWTRFDPTELVSPERISLGSNSFYDKLLNKGALALSLSLFTQNKFIIYVDNLISYVESSLNNQFFNLDYNDQKRLFNNRAGAIFVTVLLLFIFSFFIIIRTLKKLRLNPEERKYQNFIKKMKEIGLEKGSSETALEFYRRCLETDKTISEKYKDVLDNYIKKSYGKF